MTQIIININNTKKWDELKPILESMDIDYSTQNSDIEDKLSETELELLSKAGEDVNEGRIFGYTNNRNILGR